MLDGYRADDRKDEDEGEDPGQPVTATALMVMWAERDSRYATLKYALRHEQIEAIRMNRVAEARLLPRGEQGRAGLSALAWYPPMHGQGAE